MTHALLFLTANEPIPNANAFADALAAFSTRHLKLWRELLSKLLCRDAICSEHCGTIESPEQEYTARDG
jgi:hypothetical protein